MQQSAFAGARYVDCRMRGVASHRFMTGRATEFFGRLIRVSSAQRDRNTIAYIVAMADPKEAMELIRANAAEPGSLVEDLGRVSDALLRSLNLLLGEFVRADEPHRLR